MIIRQVSIELNEKQYEKLCQVAASAGKTVRKVLQTFAEELPERIASRLAWAKAGKKLPCIPVRKRKA